MLQVIAYRANRRESTSVQTRGEQHIRGIDVSHWQGDIDWQKVKADGIRFAIIKATEGTAFVDPNFKRNVNGARAAGVRVGAYHYAHPDKDPIQQVEHLLRTMEGLKLDFPPALDLEVNHGLSKEQVTHFALRWLSGIERRIGRKPIFYSYTSFIQAYIGAELGSWPLWIAHYDVDRPRENGVWESWQVFQYRSTGRVNGIAGSVDMNAMEEGFFTSQTGGEAMPLPPKEPSETNATHASEPSITVEDANTIIRFLSAGYYAVVGHAQAQEEFHRLADVLRRASGQMTE